jgi:hypothetical protein
MRAVFLGWRSLVDNFVISISAVIGIAVVEWHVRSPGRKGFQAGRSWLAPPFVSILVGWYESRMTRGRQQTMWRIGMAALITWRTSTLMVKPRGLFVTKHIGPLMRTSRLWNRKPSVIVCVCLAPGPLTVARALGLVKLHLESIKETWLLTSQMSGPGPQCRWSLALLRSMVIAGSFHYPIVAHLHVGRALLALLRLGLWAPVRSRYICAVCIPYSTNLRLSLTLLVLNLNLDFLAVSYKVAGFIAPVAKAATGGPCWIVMVVVLPTSILVLARLVALMGVGIPWWPRALRWLTAALTATRCLIPSNCRNYRIGGRGRGRMLVISSRLGLGRTISVRRRSLGGILLWLLVAIVLSRILMIAGWLRQRVQVWTVELIMVIKRSWAVHGGIGLLWLIWSCGLLRLWLICCGLLSDVSIVVFYSIGSRLLEELWECIREEFALLDIGSDNTGQLTHNMMPRE